MSTVSGDTAEGESPADHNADVDPHQIDWPAFFEAHITNERFDRGAETLGGYVNYYLDNVANEANGIALVKAALDAGLLKDTPEGIEPADPDPDEDDDHNSRVVEVGDPDERTNGAPDHNTAVVEAGELSEMGREELEETTLALGQKLADLTGEVEAMKQEVADLREQHDDHEERITENTEKSDRAVSKAEEMTAVAEKWDDQIKASRGAAIQMLAWRLNEGKSVAVDNIPLEKFREQVDMELQFFGNDDQYVEAADPKHQQDGINGQQLPFPTDDLLKIERHRQLWKRGSTPLEALSGSDAPNSHTRAVILWHHMGSISDTVGYNNDTLRIPTGKARDFLVEHGQLDASRSKTSLNKSVNDAFSKMKDLTDGLVTTEVRGRSGGVEAKKEQVEAAQKPLHEVTDAGSGAIFHD